MDIPFDGLWYPEECAEYLVNEYDSELEVALWRDIHAGMLPADKREGVYTPPKLDPLQMAAELRFGAPAKWIPAKEYRYLVKPIDAIKWAVDAGIDINEQCREFYERVTADPKKKRQSGPREETLLRVIAGLAKAYGYDPTSGQRKQNKLDEIVTHSGLDPKTIREAVKAAISSA